MTILEDFLRSARSHIICGSCFYDQMARKGGYWIPYLLDNEHSKRASLYLPFCISSLYSNNHVKISAYRLNYNLRWQFRDEHMDKLEAESLVTAKNSFDTTTAVKVIPGLVCEVACCYYNPTTFMDVKKQLTSTFALHHIFCYLF